MRRVPERERLGGYGQWRTLRQPPPSGRQRRGPVGTVGGLPVGDAPATQHRNQKAGEHPGLAGELAGRRDVRRGAGAVLGQIHRDHAADQRYVPLPVGQPGRFVDRAAEDFADAGERVAGRVVGDVAVVACFRPPRRRCSCRASCRRVTPTAGMRRMSPRLPRCCRRGRRRGKQREHREPGACSAGQLKPGELTALGKCACAQAASERLGAGSGSWLSART